MDVHTLAINNLIQHRINLQALDLYGPHLNRPLYMQRPLSICGNVQRVAASTLPEDTAPPTRPWKSLDLLDVPAHRPLGDAKTRWRYLDCKSGSAVPAKPVATAPPLDAPAVSEVSRNSASPRRADATYDKRTLSDAMRAARSHGAAHAPAYPSPDAGTWTLATQPAYATNATNAGTPADATRMELLGCQLNELRLPQCNDVKKVYRIEPLQVSEGRRASLMSFDSDMLLRSNGQEGRYLLTMESREAAIDFGEQHYGAGNYELFRLDAKGLPAVRYRSHAHLSLLCNDEEPLRAEGGRAFQRGDVYLDVSELGASRIHREPVKRFRNCCAII